MVKPSHPVVSTNCADTPKAQLLVFPDQPLLAACPTGPKLICLQDSAFLLLLIQLYQLICAEP